jgi:hypothetical protein
VLLWGAAPLIVGVDLEVVKTNLDPGMFATCVLIYRLVAEPGVRARLASLERMGVPELLALFLVGGLQVVVHLSDNVQLGGSLGFLLGVIAVLLGLAGTSRAAVLWVNLLATSITLAVALLGRDKLAFNWLTIAYAVNFVALILLYEIGRAWVRELAVPVRNFGPRGRIAALSLGLLIVDLGQMLAGLQEVVAPFAASQFLAFVAIGSRAADRPLPVALTAALLIALIVAAIGWILAFLFLMPFSNLTGSLAWLWALPSILGSAWLGWALARWAQGPGAAIRSAVDHACQAAGSVIKVCRSTDQQYRKFHSKFRLQHRAVCACALDLGERLCAAGRTGCHPLPQSARTRRILRTPFRNSGTSRPRFSSASSLPSSSWCRATGRKLKISNRIPSLRWARNLHPFQRRRPRRVHRDYGADPNRPVVL